MTQSLEQAYENGQIQLLISDASGIYIPQEFARSYVVQEASLDGDMEICAAGPDEEYYWESWENILNHGTIMGTSGKAWTLMQDGDLWAIVEGAEIDLEA